MGLSGFWCEYFGIPVIGAVLRVAFRDLPASNLIKRNTAPTESNYSKRQQGYSYPINRCPSPGLITDLFDTFEGSMCFREASAREATIACSLRTAGWSFYQVHDEFTCSEGEICVDGAFERPKDTAWCVSEVSFIALATAAMVNYHQLPAVLNPNPQVGDAVEVILRTREDADVLFQTRDITITPINRDGHWLLPPASCSECSSLRLSDVPVRTANFAIDITLPNPSDEAVMVGFIWRQP
ncbi:hypothetical protein EV356DRAFT_2034 [Viridothelium virens]|uniref:Uncharacterized protein n=1 Tax=Viridothelium virens TaxID=1048519 RepID=A0A6A6HP25_VIRVR|nr:hypothetical protein EV356DRAFT_2034 [Viridothelium virens]